MRPLAVVVDVDAEDAFEVTPIQDQQPVQALGAYRSDERSATAFRLGARTGACTIRNALALKDLIERTAVLAVAAADQEAEAPIVLWFRDHYEYSDVQGFLLCVSVCASQRPSRCGAGRLEHLAA
jgi:hypothetical protein